MPGGLLSAISGILAGGILGFGAAGTCFAGHLCLILLCDLLFRVLSWARSVNSPAHLLRQFLGADLSILFAGFCGFVCFVCCFVCLVCFGFVWFVFFLGWFCFALFCFVLFRLTSVDVAWPVLHF